MRQQKRQGGIQAADGPNDSPAIHYIDAFGGGGYAAKPQLLKKLVREAPEAIKWLTDFGVTFDKTADGEPVTTHGGGTSRKRMHACKDATGLEIMRTLKSEVACKGIPVAEYSLAVEIIKDENGNAAGAVLANTETGGLSVVKAKTVIIATGGAGRLHCQGFPTSNHYGATADGLAIAYRAGAKLICADTLQYHPTGVAEPSRMLGALVTEKVRALGAQLVNKNGEAFVNPLEPRDVTAAAIIRECKLGNGIKTANGFGVWLDTPMIEIVNGEGTIEKRLPSTFSTFEKAGIDIRKEPILVYPTLHYQNGGIEIDENCEAVGVKNLFACGEAAGGIHGRNRLMGNSLADIIVFGKTAGMVAAERSKDIRVGKLTLEHPVRPFVAILGGAKVADKLNVISNLLEKCDTLIIGGGMAYTFLKAQGYEVGKSLVDDTKIDYCKEMMAKAAKEGKKLLLPVDGVEIKDFPDPIDAPVETVVRKVGEFDKDMESADIGPETCKLYADALKGAKTIIWNGPMGVFENPTLAAGTIAIAKSMADCKGATTIIGGGDSAAAVTQLGFADKMTHISTGGGASLELFEGKKLPGIECLNDKK